MSSQPPNNRNIKKDRISEPGPGPLSLKLKDTPYREANSSGNSPASTSASLNRDLLDQVIQTRSRSLSISGTPASQSPSTSNNLVTDSINVVAGSREKISKSPTQAKSDVCPCRKSSSGRELLLPCTKCKQVWHNSCTGLKGNFTKAVLESLLKTWHCPWC